MSQVFQNRFDLRLMIDDFGFLICACLVPKLGFKLRSAIQNHQAAIINPLRLSLGLRHRTASKEKRWYSSYLLSSVSYP